MIDMLSVLFPADAVRFRFTHNEFKSLDVGLGRFVRDRRLTNAFDSTKTLHKALDIGELWIFELGAKSFASYSFAGLLRARGKDVPEMFDDVPPVLPRHDAGLVLEYSSEQVLPWRMQWFSEAKKDRQQCRAMTLRVLLSEAFAFDSGRAAVNAKGALDPSSYRPKSH